MSSTLLIRSGLFTPKIWQQTVRHRGKFNYKMPKPRHEVARYIEEITRPVIIRELPDQVEKCVENKSFVAKNLKFSTSEAADFEKFLATYALKLINKYEVMLICHKLDCAGEVLRRNRVEFKKNETEIWNFNTIIMNLLIENNPEYKNLSPIVSTGLGRNSYLFFNEANLKKNINLLKRMPHYVLLGGMINGRLYTKQGIQDYLNMGTIDDLRAQLCGLLNQQLALVPNTLSQPINSLANALKQHAQSGQEETKK